MELFAQLGPGILRHRHLAEVQESSLPKSIERGLSDGQGMTPQHHDAKSLVSSYPDLWGLVGMVGLGLVIVGVAIWMTVF